MPVLTDMLLRIVDITTQWMLISESPFVTRKRVLIHSLLFVLVLIINISNVIYLNSINAADYITVFSGIIQTVLYAIVLAIVVINDEASGVNLINDARQVHAAWVSFVLLLDPIIMLLSGGFSGKYRSTVRQVVKELASVSSLSKR
jgi:hypothetical protein